VTRAIHWRCRVVAFAKPQIYAEIGRTVMEESHERM
jgi:hypothetical protein